MTGIVEGKCATCNDPALDCHGGFCRECLMEEVEHFLKNEASLPKGEGFEILAGAFAKWKKGLMV